VDIICDVVLADRLKTIFQTRQFHITPEGIKELIDNPYIIPGLSDGGAHTKYLTGGGYGTEYISNLVREREFSSLEDAHWRLSALPASCAGFSNRGTLREGAAADIIVYDYEKLGYSAPEFSRDLPGNEYRVICRGRGYRYVLVNGAVTIEDDRQTNTHSGMLLRQ
jgi:N-acyl-D-aspartate/D-glutamate deacylase